MKYLVNAEEMRRYDENTIERIGIPGLVLMERAALAALGAVERHCSGLQAGERSALILAGVGNNGGDGLALARLLCEAGFSVEVWIAGDPGKASKQWESQRRILENYPVETGTKPRRSEYTVLIDALFGVGLSREIAGEYREALELYGRLSGYRIALDLPSGVDSDTGVIRGIAPVADETVAFGFCKRGLVLYPGCEYAGKVTVAEIGITQRSFLGTEPGMFFLDEAPGELLPAREKSGNKGTFGKVLLAAGSVNMAGAAVLAAKAAYRIGAGMVKVITPEENRVILQTAVPEALLGKRTELEESLEWADVIAVGPGLGKGPEAYACLKRIIGSGGKPLVIDADGLNLLAGAPELMEELAKGGALGRETVLTPHMGELSRLTGMPVSRLKEDPAGYGTELAKRLHCVVAAKDARTFVCRPDGPVCVNVSGNSGMAAAGSGDVLTGVIAGLLAQGMEAFPAAAAGVRLHGLAGDAASAEKGEHACMAGDIVEELCGFHV